MTRTQAIDCASDYFDDGRFQRDLATLVAYRTESQKPERAAELPRYLEEAILPQLTRLGFACTLHPNPVEGAGPFLVAEGC